MSNYGSPCMQPLHAAPTGLYATKRGPVVARATKGWPYAGAVVRMRSLEPLNPGIIGRTVVPCR